MLKYELIFEFILILRIFRHFNIIKIVTHLEVVLQNVKRPKSDRNSGNVRNSSDYGSVLYTHIQPQTRTVTFSKIQRRMNIRPTVNWRN